MSSGQPSPPSGLRAAASEAAVVRPAAASEAAVDLLGLLAYAELVSFQRLAVDAWAAPTLADKAALGRLAVAEFASFERISAHVAGLGRRVEDAMAPFVAAFDTFHAQTAPTDWLESLVKTYVGDGIARDFYREVARSLDAETVALVERVLKDNGHAAFAVARVRGAIAAEPAQAGRLALWARRIVGEAITQARQVAAEREALVGLVLADSADLGAVFARLLEAHRARMAALGLAA